MQRITKLPNVERKEGLRLEGIVVKHLETLYEIVEPSMPYENIQRDIDVRIRNNVGRWVSLSIKVNNPEYYLDPFLFELEQAWYKTDEDSQILTEVEPYVSQSWYYKGRADYYLVWKRRTLKAGKLFCIDKQKLNEYVDEHGFDKVTKQRADVQRREVLEGKAWTSLGLIDQEKLVNLKIALHIGTIQ